MIKININEIVNSKEVKGHIEDLNSNKELFIVENEEQSKDYGANIKSVNSIFKTKVERVGAVEDFLCDLGLNANDVYENGFIGDIKNYKMENRIKKNDKKIRWINSEIDFSINISKEFKNVEISNIGNVRLNKILICFLGEGYNNEISLINDNSWTFEKRELNSYTEITLEELENKMNGVVSYRLIEGK